MGQIININSENLLSHIAETVKRVQVGREVLNAVRAELRAIDKVGAAEVNKDRIEKLERAQTLAEDVLDAEVTLGEYISSLPEFPGKRTDLQPDGTAAERLSKKEAIAEIGISEDQARRYEKLAENPDIVAQIKSEARNAGEIVSRTAVLNAISAAKKPYIVNNSRNDQWFTPQRYVESARKVMGSIDLDPSSCAEANITVRATHFYSEEDDGLSQPWTGNVWLNPPYSKVRLFISKLLESSEVNQAVILVNNGTETVWCKELASRASACVFHTGRLPFTKPGANETSAPMQGQIFFYLGNNPDRFLDEFLQYGWGAKLNK